MALQLANDAEVEPEDIPCVYSLHRLSQTFQVPDIDVNVLSVKAQLCFVLDYTSSMKTQVAQAKTSVARMIEAVRNMVRGKVIKHRLVVYLSFNWFSLALPGLVYLLKKVCFKNLVKGLKETPLRLKLNPILNTMGVSWGINI